MENTLKNIVSMHVEFIYEMQAEGAWCGHVYATEYFSDLRARIISTAQEIKDKYAKNQGINYCASHILFVMDTDYDALITKIYQNNSFSEWDRHSISEALNETFKDKLEDVFDDFSTIYEKLSGQEYKAVIENAVNA